MRPTYYWQWTYRALRRSQLSLVPNVGPERVCPLPGPSLRRRRPAISAERARAAAVSHTGAPARQCDTPRRAAAAEALPAASPPRLLTGPQPAADEGSVSSQRPGSGYSPAAGAWTAPSQSPPTDATDGGRSADSRRGRVTHT